MDLVYRAILSDGASFLILGVHLQHDISLVVAVPAAINGRQHAICLLRVDLGAPAAWTELGLRTLMLNLFNYVQEVSQASHLLDLDVLQGEAHVHQHVLDNLPVVTLQEDLVVLG